MKTYTATLFIKGIECEVEYEASYCPAKINGPMDQCHPDESELVVLSCERLSDDEDSVLTDEVVAAVCWEDFMNQLEPEPEPEQED